MARSGPSGGGAVGPVVKISRLLPLAVRAAGHTVGLPSAIMTSDLQISLICVPRESQKSLLFVGVLSTVGWLCGCSE